MKNFLLAIALLGSLAGYAQLQDGGIAPDFILTDYYGEEHHLYEYLDNDITVILEIFAVHCPACWNFHETDKLKNLYNQYGSDGTNELMVLALDYDPGNGHDEWIGIGPPWVASGNWLEDTPYPQFNVEGDDRSVFDDYNVTGYPVVYAICPDRVLERIPTWNSEAEFYDRVLQCQESLGIEDGIDLGNVSFNSQSNILTISKYEEVQRVSVFAITGQVLQSITAFGSNSIQIENLTTGIYLFEIRTERGSVTKRFYVK
jgi:hypothetical protein